MGGGSSRENPIHSHEQIPQRGYGDGYGNFGTKGKSHGLDAFGKCGFGLGAYYAAKGGGKGYPHQPYGYAPDGQWPYGPYGYVPYGKGDGGKKGNVHIVQAAMEYPLKGEGKGKGKSKGKAGGTDQELGGGGSSRSPSATQERGWAARKARRDASQTRSEARPTTGPPGNHWDLLNDQPQPASPSPTGTAPPREVTFVVDQEATVIVDQSVPTPLQQSHPNHSTTEAEDPKAIGITMESITMCLEGLKGRTDLYATKVREGLECDLQQMRIRRTKLKPLGNQVAILQALVEKKLLHFTAAEELVNTSIAKMEAAKAALTEAQTSLLNVKNQKEEADAKAATAAAASAATEAVPDNAASLNKVKDLVCLLPTQMAGDFGQCLALLEQLLNTAKASASQPVMQQVPDSDSEMDMVEQRSTPDLVAVPLFPVVKRSCTQREHAGVPHSNWMLGIHTCPLMVA